MRFHKNVFQFGLAAASLGAFAVVAVNCGEAGSTGEQLPQGAAPQAARADGAASHAQQASTACVTIQRGSFGNVYDTMIASNIDGAHNPDNIAGDGNFGADTIAIAGKVGLGQRIAFFEWDLSAVPPNLGITSATVTLQARSDSQGGYGNTLSVYPVTGAWTEGGLTWNTAPTFNPTAVFSNTGGPGTYTFDVTALAQGWAAGPNDGIEINQNAYYYTAFYTSEDATLSLRPALDVCYVPNLCAGVTCSASGPCYAAGTCDPSSGMCSNPASPSGTACAGGTCDGSGTCVAACSGGETDCGGVCTNTSDDTNNCGSCGDVCTLPGGAENASAACHAGSCSLTCAAGYGNCDGNEANGCETSTISSNTNCGSCGNTCPSGYACSEGICESVSCPPPPGASGSCSSTVFDENWTDGTGRWALSNPPYQSPLVIETDSSACMGPYLHETELASAGHAFTVESIPVTAGNTYCLGGWIRGSTNTAPFLGVVESLSNGGVNFDEQHWLIGQACFATGFGNDVSPVIPDGAWRWYARSFTMPTGWTNLHIYLEEWNGGAAGSSDFGEVELFAGACPVASGTVCTAATCP